jgi:hypothetical protein
MPRDGAIIFGDLIGKLDVLRIECGNQLPRPWSMHHPHISSSCIDAYQ